MGYFELCDNCDKILLRCTCPPARIVRCEVPGCDWSIDLRFQRDIDVALGLHLVAHGLDLEFVKAGRG